MDAAPISIADAVIVLVLLVSGVFAFFRGFVHELLSVISWIGAAVATLYGFPYLQPHARGFITVPLIADIMAGAAIFLVVLVLLTVITRIIAHRIRNSAFGPLDRSLGLVFGFLRGAVLICLAWLAFVWLLPEREDHPEWITEAKSRSLVERGSIMLVQLLPKHLRDRAGVEVERARSRTEQLNESQKMLQDLLNPPTKGDAQNGEPSYNSQQRNDMKRAIEGVSGPKEGAE